MPVMAGIILAPRLIVFIEDAYLASYLGPDGYKTYLLTGYTRYIVAAILSFMILNGITNILKMLGMVKAPDRYDFLTDAFQLH